MFNFASLYFLRGKNGFTLIELAVVMLLFILTAAFAVPNVAKVIPRYRLKEASRGIYSDLQLAKLTAVKEGTPCTVEFTSTGYQIFIDVNENLERDGVETGNQYLLKQVNWSDYKDVELDTSNGGGDGLSFMDNDNGNPAISFLPTGLTINNIGGLGVGTVFLRLKNDTSKQMRVVVNSTASIRIE